MPKNSLALPEPTSTELASPWPRNATLASEDGTALGSETASPPDVAAQDTFADEEPISRTPLTVDRATYAPKVTIVRLAPQLRSVALQVPMGLLLASSAHPSAPIAVLGITAKALETRTSPDPAPLDTTAPLASPSPPQASICAHTDNAAPLPLLLGLVAHPARTLIALVAGIATRVKLDTTVTKPCHVTTAGATHLPTVSRTTLASVRALSVLIAPLVQVDLSLAQLGPAATSSFLKVSTLALLARLGSTACWEPTFPRVTALLGTTAAEERTSPNPSTVSATRATTAQRVSGIRFLAHLESIAIAVDFLHQQEVAVVVSTASAPPIERIRSMVSRVTSALQVRTAPPTPACQFLAQQPPSILFSTSQARPRASSALLERPAQVPVSQVLPVPLIAPQGSTAHQECRPRPQHATYVQ
jgi:hypothetical protein